MVITHRTLFLVWNCLKCHSMDEWRKTCSSICPHMWFWYLMWMKSPHMNCFSFCFDKGRQRVIRRQFVIQTCIKTKRPRTISSYFTFPTRRSADDLCLGLLLKTRPRTSCRHDMFSKNQSADKLPSWHVFKRARPKTTCFYDMLLDGKFEDDLL